MKKQKTYTELQYNLIKHRLDTFTNHYIKETTDLQQTIQDQKTIINSLEYEIKELKTPFYIKLMRKQYDKVFYIFIAFSFFYFFFHFITL